MKSKKILAQKFSVNKQLKKKCAKILKSCANTSIPLKIKMYNRDTLDLKYVASVWKRKTNTHFKLNYSTDVANTFKLKCVGNIILLFLFSISILIIVERD